MAKILSGTIILWSGNTGNVPGGWLLCDGNNGTPNLLNRFVVGAGSTYTVGSTGGSDTVTLTSNNIPAHPHGVGTVATSSSGTHTHTTSNYALAVYGSISGAFGPGSNASFLTGGGNSTTSSVANHTHTVSGGTISSTGGGSAHENRPAFRALVYIMKA